MQLSEIFRLVLINIKQNKFKVFLTSLGIIVGTATIVMVIAIGEGGKRDVAEQFKTLNAGTITVSSSSSTGGMGGMGAMGGSRKSGGGAVTTIALPTTNENMLTENSLEDIMFFVPDIANATILATSKNDVAGGILEEAQEYSIVGTQSDYQQISNLSLSIGEFITPEDLENQTRCVVLGYNVATEIFGSPTQAYDSKIEIDGRTYIVNGVLAPMGTVVSGVNPDETIFTPYTTAEKYIFGRNLTPQFSILSSDVDDVSTVMANIESVLKQSNPDATFTIADAGATMDVAMQSANTLSLLLMAVAVIVFIVGGIGIMNVLFVSIKERTREIGVLKAIGTKKRDILMLFITEANMIGFLGGIVGVILSFALIPAMKYLDISAILTIPAVVIALCFAVITGTLFGFYPALKASNLIPIKALNNE